MRTVCLAIVLCCALIPSAEGLCQPVPDGTCMHPYVLNDSSFVITTDTIRDARVWFSFRTSQTALYISITDMANRPYNYMIFKYTGTDFCNDIARKALVPERNKVCLQDIEIDAAGTLSYENINRGICNCPTCCHSNIMFQTVPGQLYYVVVYNPGERIMVDTRKAQLHIAQPVVAEKKEEKPANEPRKFDPKMDVNDIAVGERIELENIYFEPGVAVFLRTSYDALDDLFAFMKNNPSVKIEIQGHVNGPNAPPDMNYSNNLGLRRARAVYDFLVSHKIDKDRLTCVGYGNTRMIFPEATSERQMARNRRVEIVILSK